MLDLVFLHVLSWGAAERGQCLSYCFWSWSFLQGDPRWRYIPQKERKDVFEEYCRETGGCQGEGCLRRAGKGQAAASRCRSSGVGGHVSTWDRGAWVVRELDREEHWQH